MLSIAASLPPFPPVGHLFTAFQTRNFHLLWIDSIWARKVQGRRIAMNNEHDGKTGQSFAERRQVTALFYDLVGSTALAHRLDPEDYRDLQQQFHQACTSAAASFGGLTQALVGDGGSVYFGYPMAREDAAERALHAALAIVSACQKLKVQRSSAAINVRVGIATGEVIISGSPYGGASEQVEVVGLAPALAARLQTVASPNSILVSETTHHLVQGFFVFEPIEALELKGFDGPQTAWRLIRARTAESRFEAMRSWRGSPLIGRAEELGALLRRWSQAVSGDGQVVLVSGEPGIGKSRLLTALRDNARQAMRMSYQCSPQHVDTALYPFIARLERLLKIPSSDPSDVVLDRLERLIGGVRGDNPEPVALLAHLLDLPGRERYPALDTNPSIVKQQTLAAIVNALERWSQKSPIIFTFEDAHWIDPTSQELLDLVIERSQHLPILVVVTFRPDYAAHSWAGQSHVMLLQLNRLTRQHARTIVENLSANQPLSGSVIDQIVERTDGIPLFVEEVTAATIEQASRGSALDDPFHQVQIPTTLADSLYARLDLLEGGKAIVQTASALGRGFSFPLLSAVTGKPDEEVSLALSRLLGLGLATSHGTGKEARYTFKHALVQEAAYNGILRRDARRIHGRIAKVLQESFTNSRESAPEILAYHFQASGQPENAIAALKTAAQNAAQRSATREAAKLLERAQRLMEALPVDGQRNKLELELLAIQGPTLIALKGPGASEVQALYERGVLLAGGMSPEPGHFPIYWSWWRTSPTFGKGRERADRILEFSSKVTDPEVRLQAHHCQWATLFMVGDHATCCKHARDGLLLYETGDYKTHQVLYGGHDPKVCAYAELALSRWLQGFPESAMTDLDECIKHAMVLEHNGSIGHSMDAEIMVHRYGDDVTRVYRCAQRMNAFADENGFPDLAAKGKIFLGWAMAHLGELDRGILLIQQGLDAQRTIGVEDDFPVYFEMLADAHGLADHPEKGLPLVEEAVAMAGRTGLQYWSAELYRRKGELLLQHSKANVSASVDCFEQAVRISEAQEAKALTLRGLMSLTRTVAGTSRHPLAVRRLRQTYEAFSEGFETKDLCAARLLLANGTRLSVGSHPG